MTSRDSNFSSSAIHRLTSCGRAANSVGAPFFSYIAEKRQEKRLQRAISKDVNAKAVNWGKLCEPIVFEMLSVEYKRVHRERLVHAQISNWTGIPDITKPKENRVADIKCPYTIKSFCDLADSFNDDGDYTEFKKHSPEYYWQLVSNAALSGCNKAELIVFAPYKSQLNEIRDLANTWTEGDQNRVAFVNWASDDELPYLVEGAYYKNITRFNFDVDADEIEFLQNRVKIATALLHADEATWRDAKKVKDVEKLIELIC